MMYYCELGRVVFASILKHWPQAGSRSEMLVFLDLCRWLQAAVVVPEFVLNKIARRLETALQSQVSRLELVGFVFFVKGCASEVNRTFFMHILRQIKLEARLTTKDGDVGKCFRRLCAYRDSRDLDELKELLVLVRKLAGRDQTFKALLGLDMIMFSEKKQASSACMIL